MADWFRNDAWSEEIEALFEAKLARARDKSQYLKLQGYHLLKADPAVAARLLDRCAQLDDHWRADALLYLGQARLRLGDVQGAVAALDAAIAQEQRVRWARTGARSDLALMVAFYCLSDRYDEMLAYLAVANRDPQTALTEELAAQAMIMAAVGDSDRARPPAREALRWLDGLTEGTSDQGIGPAGGMSVATLRQRLSAIAG